jgi:hypothetical protein
MEKINSETLAYFSTTYYICVSKISNQKKQGTMEAKEYVVIKSYKGLEIVKFDQPIRGGLYGVVYHPEKKAKNGLSLDAAIELFNNCIK